MNETTQEQIVETLKSLTLKVGEMSGSAWEIMVKANYLYGIIALVIMGILVSVITSIILINIIGNKWEFVNEDYFGGISLLACAASIIGIIVCIIHSMKFFLPEYYALKELMGLL